MIKTLRITSIVAAILAGIFLVSSVVFGVRSDEQVEEFLNSAGVVEKFNQSEGNKVRRSENQVSPLVQQAQAFALYLNPPEPKKAVTQRKGPRIPLPPTPPPPPQFKVIGTCVHASNPEQSLVFIDEPGKGMHWVRQSSVVSHLVIEQIKDGLIVVKDNERTFELAAEQRPTKNVLLVGPSSGPIGSKSTLPVPAKARADVIKNLLEGPSSGAVGSKPPLPVPAKARAGAPGSGPPQGIDERRAAFMKIFANEIKAKQAGAKSDKTDTGQLDERKAALKEMEKHISGLQSTRVSPEEANRLDRLGKELKNLREALDKAKSRRTNKEGGSRRPNRPPSK